MAGMVSVPVVNTFEVTEPDIEPIRPEANTATLAAPPRTWPRSANDISRKNRPAPVNCKVTPKSRNPTTSEAKALIGKPNMLCVLMM